jgi:hypothetical protein
VKLKPGKRTTFSRFDKTYIPTSSAALARTHRIIRIEREKEIMFMKLCSQIRLDDSKQNRAAQQREQRRIKRVMKHCATISE